MRHRGTQPLLLAPAALILTLCSGCGMVWTFWEERFPESFSAISVVSAEDGRPVQDPKVSFDLLAMQHGGFEGSCWHPTLLQEGERIKPPRPAGKRAAVSAGVSVGVSVQAGAPAIVRPFPPGDPHARVARSFKLTQQADGSLSVEPCRVLAGRQLLHPFATRLGNYLEYDHCAVIKVSAPGYAELEWWSRSVDHPGYRYRSDRDLYREYEEQAFREGIMLEGSIDAMPHEAGWCEIADDHVLRFHLKAKAPAATQPATTPAAQRNDPAVEKLRAELFGGNLRDPEITSLEPTDSRVIAIDRLKQIGSPEAVKVLGTLLTTKGVGGQIKERTLLALGKSGSPETIKAIDEFESWAKTRFKPWPFQITPAQRERCRYMAPHELIPTATAKDPQGQQWILFRWTPFGWRERDLWLVRDTGEDVWSTPLLVDPPGLPFLKIDAKLGLQAEAGGRFELTANDQSYAFTLEDLERDSDQDGLPDSVERILGTDPAKPDTDGDGVKDGLDNNPLIPKSQAKPSEEAKIRQAVFTALFAFGDSAGVLVVLDHGDLARQEYSGSCGYVIKAPEIRPGFVNIARLDIKLLASDGAAVTFSASGGDPWGCELRLRKIHGKWVVVDIPMTWISRPPIVGVCISG